MAAAGRTQHGLASRHQCCDDRQQSARFVGCQGGRCDPRQTGQSSGPLADSLLAAAARRRGVRVAWIRLLGMGGGAFRSRLCHLVPCDACTHWAHQPDGPLPFAVRTRHELANGQSQIVPSTPLVRRGCTIDSRRLLPPLPVRFCGCCIHRPGSAGCDQSAGQRGQIDRLLLGRCRGTSRPLRRFKRYSGRRGPGIRVLLNEHVVTILASTLRPFWCRSTSYRRDGRSVRRVQLSWSGRSFADRRCSRSWLCCDATSTGAMAARWS